MSVLNIFRAVKKTIKIRRGCGAKVNNNTILELRLGWLLIWDEEDEEEKNRPFISFLAAPSLYSPSSPRLESLSNVFVFQGDTDNRLRFLRGSSSFSVFRGNTVSLAVERVSSLSCRRSSIEYIWLVFLFAWLYFGGLFFRFPGWRELRQGKERQLEKQSTRGR